VRDVRSRNRSEVAGVVVGAGNRGEEGARESAGAGARRPGRERRERIAGTPPEHELVRWRVGLRDDRAFEAEPDEDDEIREVFG